MASAAFRSRRAQTGYSFERIIMFALFAVIIIFLFVMIYRQAGAVS